MKLFTSVFDDVRLLRHFLRHYAAAGVDDFFILVASDLADAVELRRAEYDITLTALDRGAMSASFVRGSLASDHMAVLRHRHQGPNEWAIIADLDEFIEFEPGVASVVAIAEGEGANVVRGIMHDRFSADGTPHEVLPDVELARQFPVRSRFIRIVKGGWDHKASMVKGPLEPPAGTEHHRVIGERIASITLTIDHYKWTAGSIERLRERCKWLRAAGSPWAREDERALAHYEKHGRFAWEEFGGELLVPTAASGVSPVQSKRGG